MSTSTTPGSWAVEILDGHVSVGFRVSETLLECDSPYQRIKIVDTQTYGRALMLDGRWMSAERDEAHYHEMLVHPAMTTNPNIGRILIIGGGDGGTAREVLRYSAVESVDMVEIDGMVIRATQELMPSLWRGADSDSRLRIHVADAIEWLRTTPSETYDVVIVDGSDPVGPAIGLYQPSFFESCRRVMKHNGLFVTQGESPSLMRDTHLALIDDLKSVFGFAYPYYGSVGVYPGGSWSWIAASATVDPLEPMEDRLAEIEPNMEVYNAALHRGAFLCVPTSLQRRVEKS